MVCGVSGNQVDFSRLGAKGTRLAVGVKENINVTSADTAADVLCRVYRSVYIEAAADGNDGGIHSNGSAG